MSSKEQTVTDLIDDEFADDEVSNKPGHKVSNTVSNK